MRQIRQDTHLPSFLFKSLISLADLGPLKGPDDPESFRRYISIFRHREFRRLEPTYRYSQNER